MQYIMKAIDILKKHRHTHTESHIHTVTQTHAHKHTHIHDHTHIHTMKNLGKYIIISYATTYKTSAE